MKKVFCVGLCALLSACSASDPEVGAGIDYRLPRTDVTVTMGVDITSCGPSAVLDVVQIKPSLKSDIVAGAQAGVYHLSGRDLISASTKRKIEVAVDDNGVLSSINSTATDQRAAILGNVVKLAATVVGAGAKGGDNWVFVCKPLARLALQQIEAINGKIAALRSSLATAAAPDPIQQQINLLAGQVVTISATLHRDMSTSVALDDSWSKPKPLAFDLSALDDILLVAHIGPNATNGEKPVPPSQAAQFTGLNVQAYFEDHTINAVKAVDAPSTEGRYPCDQSMFVPSPKSVTFTVEPRGEYFSGRTSRPDHGVTKTVLVASQLAAPAKLCISARFGEDRTLNLQFNKFGQVKDFTWDVASQAGNIANALAGAAPDGSKIVTTIQGEGLASEKAELDRLTTQQNLKKAQACQALLDAGASSCQ